MCYEMLFLVPHGNCNVKIIVSEDIRKRKTHLEKYVNNMTEKSNSP